MQCPERKRDKETMADLQNVAGGALWTFLLRVSKRVVGGEYSEVIPARLLVPRSWIVALQSLFAVLAITASLGPHGGASGFRGDSCPAQLCTGAEGAWPGICDPRGSSMEAGGAEMDHGSFGQLPMKPLDAIHFI